MSYSLGQAKWVPGQISFASLPQGRTGLPSVQPLLEAGLPIAPYIEHGSFTTGEPAIMRYGLDPYRGIMGTDCAGLGCWLFGRSSTPASAAPTPAASSSIIEAMARPGSGIRASDSAVAGNGVVECNGAVVYRGDALTSVMVGTDHSRRNRVPCTITLTGTPQGDHTVRTDAEGNMIRERRRPARTGTSGLGQGGGAAEPVKMSFELVLTGEPRGEYLYEELSEAADALAMAFSRSGKAGKVVSPPGSENVVADIEPGRGAVRMLHGLGQTIGQSVRRMEAQNYLVRCERGGRSTLSVPVRGMTEAMKTSKRMLRRDPRAVCRILLAQPTLTPGAEVVTVRKAAGDEYDVRFNYSLAGGLGDLLTEYACSSTALSAAWTNRTRAAVNASRVAAVLSGVAVGGIAAAVSENSIPLGALGGGITSFLINALWMGPHTI
jgi:hypothetical protein